MKIPIFFFLILSLLLSSCTGTSEVDPGGYAYTEPADRVESTPIKLTQSATGIPLESSKTSVPTLPQLATLSPVKPTTTPTPQVLRHFSYPQLNPDVNPVSYLDNTCQYLEARWDENKSKPGTIVVPIMFHSIAKPGREITDSSTISTAYFEYFMETAKEMGFSTITVDELVGFLEDNQAIPEKSMILILDDRRPGVTELFMPYLEEYDWTLTLAWPTTDNSSETLWERMISLAASGRLDVQSHGHDHIYIQDYTLKEEIEEEVYKSFEVIQSRFGPPPQAFIWPGGNFTGPAIDLARDAGFELGFTVYSRGPLMFNWIPLGEPEIAMEDPLMVLPRYWSTAADVALEQAIAVSDEAKQHAEAVEAAELQYYHFYCQPEKSE